MTRMFLPFGRFISDAQHAQAFYLARTGRPGPVLVDVPKDIQQQLAVPDWDAPMAIAGYMSRLPPPPEERQVAAVIQALHEVGPERMGLEGSSTSFTNQRTPAQPARRAALTTGTRDLGPHLANSSPDVI